MADILFRCGRIDVLGIVGGEEETLDGEVDAVINLQGIKLLIEGGDRSWTTFTSRDGAGGQLRGGFGVAHDSAWLCRSEKKKDDKKNDMVLYASSGHLLNQVTPRSADSRRAR